MLTLMHAGIQVNLRLQNGTHKVTRKKKIAKQSKNNNPHFIQGLEWS